MEMPHFPPLSDGLELTYMEMGDGQLRLQVTATSGGSPCPLCGQLARRMHSRYSRVVKDLPCAGQQVQLILHVRKFFCDTADCVRKIFTERLPQLVAPWAQMTIRLCQAIAFIGLASCGRLGARLASRLGIATSWMTIVRRVMALPTKPAGPVHCLGIDDFSFLRGRTFGTVLVDLDSHQVIDLLPDRQTETATTWRKSGEPCVIGSSEESLLMSGQGASVRVISIPTRHMCSNAGNRGNATEHTSGRKLQLRVSGFTADGLSLSENAQST